MYNKYVIWDYNKIRYISINRRIVMNLLFRLFGFRHLSDRQDLFFRQSVPIAVRILPDMPSVLPDDTFTGTEANRSESTHCPHPIHVSALTEIGIKGHVKGQGEGPAAVALVLRRGPVV